MTTASGWISLSQEQAQCDALSRRGKQPSFNLGNADLTNAFAGNAKRQSRARGYDPITLQNAALPRSSARAVATFASSSWPRMSM